MSSLSKSHRFLSCDWGTSSFRLRLIEAANSSVVAEASSDEGIAGTFIKWKERGGACSRWDYYIEVIERRLAGLEAGSGASLAGVPLVLSGMASATIGMCEVPYKELPFAVDGSDLRVETRSATTGFPHEVIIISGACTSADVMRGEEVQLVGALMDESAGAAERLLLFPGTHSKHITVRDGKAVSLRTYMTGEFFDLLARKSVLAQSVGEGGGLMTGAHLESFAAGARAGARGNVLHEAFRVRVRSILDKVSGEESFHYLSGLLIGCEIGAMPVDARDMTIVGDTVLGAAYGEAARVLGIHARAVRKDGGVCLIKGQCAIARRLGVIA